MKKRKKRKSNPTDQELLKKIRIIKTFDGKNIAIYEIFYRVTFNSPDVFIGEAKFDKIFKQILRIDLNIKRKGIGTYVYDFIERDQNTNLIPTRALTPDAKAFWEKRHKKNPYKSPIGENPYREVTAKHKAPKSWWDTKKVIKDQFIHDKWYLFINNDLNYEVFQFAKYNSEPLFYKYRIFSKEKFLMPYSRIVYDWPDNSYFLGPFLSLDEAIKYATKNGFSVW